jgi:hypothetical protein
MHDATAAANTLHTRYGITMANVFDTQVAHSVFAHVRHGRPLAETRPISFVNLLRQHHPQAVAQTPPAVQTYVLHRRAHKRVGTGRIDRSPTKHCRTLPNMQ